MTANYRYSQGIHWRFGNPLVSSRHRAILTAAPRCLSKLFDVPNSNHIRVRFRSSLLSYCFAMHLLNFLTCASCTQHGPLLASGREPLIECFNPLTISMINRQEALNWKHVRPKKLDSPVYRQKVQKKIVLLRKNTTPTSMSHKNRCFCGKGVQMVQTKMRGIYE